MAQARCTTLILVTNTVSARQWKDELVRRTTLTPDEIGEYSGSRKEVRPVTIATYQVITTKRHGVHPHLELFEARDWGLVIYDEVHLLPAPVFRMTADLQARRRLGLTATLVREDGHEDDVFSLIGPKRYDAPWKELENQGYIAPADCVEVRVTLDDGERMACALAEPDVRYRMAATQPSKNGVVQQLVLRHRGQPTLIIGQYVDQLEELAEQLDCPLITGHTSSVQRQRIYQEFRDGEIDLLVVSKVANFSIDLPSAEVAIQVSGAFGSRQEEAQRLGRLLRPASSHPQQGQCTIGARSGLLETIGIGEFGYARCVSSGSCRDVAGHDPGGELDNLLVADTIRVQTRSRAPAHLGQGTAVRMRTQRPGALAQRGDLSQRSTGVDGVVTPGERSPVHPAGLSGGSHDRQSREGLVGERHPGHLVLASGTTVVPRAVGIDEAQLHHPSLQWRGTDLVTHRGGQPDHLVHAGTMLRGREIG